MTLKHLLRKGTTMRKLSMLTLSLLLLAFAGLLTAQAAGNLASSAKAGEKVFTTNCAACHQAGGTGVPGAFPPLVKHVPALLNAKGGHDYMPHLLLGGLQGKITVEGTAYNGVMPSWSQLSDQQIADVLNYVSTAWGNDKLLPKDFKPFTAADVKADRAKKLSSSQVYDLRQKLNLK